jgi:cytochrome c biogenesis protein CcmG, thiol:disulfide interchange protein DsbE
MKRIFVFIPFILFISIAGFFLRGLFLDPQSIPSVQVGHQLPKFKLQRLDQKNSWFSPDLLRGRVVLLNVWASWCDACAQEQVTLLQLAHAGVPIYGLNYKDSSVQSRAWLKKWGNPYLAIGEDPYGKVALDLGVYGAPETFIIDQKGIIRYRHVGVLTMDIWQKTILPIMQDLERQA